jgi:hemerythrin superfamily protein
MANPSNPAAGPSSNTPRGAKVVSSGSSGNLDAITLLKSDHRQVEGWFADFAASDDPLEKEELAGNICDALTVHAQIEEEIFYPAFLEAVGDEDVYDEAVDEHDEARSVIADIEALGDADRGELDSLVTDLARMIRHHVQEEEQTGGMFDLAQRANLDLDEIGARLEQRKLELMDDDATDAGYDEAANRSS